MEQNQNNLHNLVINRDGELDPDYLELLEAQQRREALQQAGQMAIRGLMVSAVGVGKVLLNAYTELYAASHPDYQQ